jgi:LPS sulfotransferase NodH
MRREANRLKHQLWLHSQWWLKRHTPYRAIFVLATPRSGSNLLVDYLNRVPEVQSLAEVLSAWLPTGPWKCHTPPAAAIRHLRYSLHTLKTPARGCKVMLEELDYCRLTVDTLAEAFPESKFLILYRQSLAQQYVSLRTALSTNQWLLKDGEIRKEAGVTINPVELRKYCDETRRRYRDLVAVPWLRERAALLSYEELTADPRRCLHEEICPLLGVPDIAPQTQLRKQNPSPLSERVTNYQEVAALLGSPLCRQQYAWPWQQQARRAA